MSEKRSILSYYFAFIIFQILVMLVQWWLGERKRKAEWERERERGSECEWDWEREARLKKKIKSGKQLGSLFGRLFCPFDQIKVILDCYYYCSNFRSEVGLKKIYNHLRLLSFFLALETQNIVSFAFFLCKCIVCINILLNALTL